MTTARLGPFVVGKLLGSGGMGRVYAAEHAELGTPVAVKVLTVADPQRVARFLGDEVRAMARLDHPHIGRVFEHGIVDGPGPFAVGTPWFAMEKLGSDLRTEVASATRWSAVAPFVLQLLDALAHAHAHGVIHRDLKLGNVMVGRSDDLRPGLKLVDFGIAALDADSARSVGTPSSMAPEQLQSGLSSVGPWTDLHALGTLVWRVLTGGRPTGEAVGPGIYLRHRSESFEPFRPSIPVPEGLEAWLRTLLSYRPRARYACCADALRALEACGALIDVDITAPVGQLAAAEATASSEVTVPALRWSVDADDMPTRTGPAATQVPRDWRATLPPAPSLHLAGAGLSLLPWRSPPFVGREELRDRLWSTTRRALCGDTPARLALTGPEGVGARALGLWWVRRLRTLSGAHAVEASSVQELVDALLQPLGIAGDLEGRRRGLERWGADFRASLDALELLDGDAPVALQVGAALEVVRALARTRPVAVFFTGEEELLLERALEAGPGTAWVTRVRGEVPSGCEELPVRPLPDRELSQLLGRMVPLEPNLHAALVQRSGGRPGRARALLQQAVPSLVPSRDGFDGRLPDDVRFDVAARLPGVSEDELRALEVAAAQGRVVHRAVWVRSSGMSPRVADALAETLVSYGFATPVPSGFVLDPELLTALRERARAAERAAPHAGAVAVTLEHLGGDALQVARCWRDAGESARAARVLLDQWHRVVRTHGTVVTASAIDEARDWLFEVPEEEALHGRAAVVAAELRLETGKVPEDEMRALQAWALARGWYDTACRATRCIAWAVTHDQPSVDAAYSAFAEAWLDRCTPLIQARMYVAWYLRLERFADPKRDDVLEAAREVGAIALEEAASVDERRQVQHLLSAMERARHHRDDGDVDALLVAAQRCVELARARGGTSLPLDLVEWGHALVSAGRWDEADAAFAESAQVSRWFAIPRAEAFALGNQAGLAGRRGDWSRAAELAERGLVGVDHPYLKAVLELVCVVRVAQGGRAREVRQTLDRLAPVLAPVRPIDDEVRFALEAIESALLSVHPQTAAVAAAMRA